MNNDEIFRSDQPHKVVMPEGSHMAASKTAEKTEPSLRKVFQEGEEFTDAHVIVEEGAGTTIRTADESVAFDANETGHSEPSQQADRIDHQKAEATLVRESTPFPTVNEPDPVETPVSSLETNISPELPTNIETRVDTQEIRKISDAPKALAEMDFPARVINLKIENDQLRKRLDLLEQRNKP